MGNYVTICNLTKAILVVRLSQLTPLYYDYDLEPGRCMQSKVGAVWFTIEVATRIFDDSDTTYENLGREAFIHMLDPTYTSEQFRNLCREFHWTPIPMDYDFHSDIWIMAGLDPCYRYCLASPGWYLGNAEHKFEITGGPATTTFRNKDGELRHDVDMDSPNSFQLTKIY